MSNRRYQLDEIKLQKMNIRLLYITQARYGADWHSVPHSHHFTELFYVTRGRGKFLVNNTKFDVQEHDMIIVNPNVSHTELGIPDVPLEYIALGINGLQFTSHDDNIPYDYSLHHFEEYNEEISFYLKTLLTEVQRKEESFNLICQNLLEILILNLVRHTKKKISIASVKKITKECRFVEQYLDEHFKEDITLETLSNLTYLNKYYLVHAFKSYKGISPINYLIEKRITEAKNLLETTNYPIAKIATMIGFSSQSYFSQVFKKETSMTPNEYRKCSDLSMEKKAILS